MTDPKARRSMFDIVRQISETENLQLNSVERSRSDGGVRFKRRSKRWSNSFAVIYKVTKTIQNFHLHDDRVLQIIRLECPLPGRSRYLAVVCNDKAKEYCLLGVDCVNEQDASDQCVQQKGSLDNCSVEKQGKETIGFVMKLSVDTVPTFTGDGGFKIRYEGRSFLFKPVSLQALWKLMQTLNMISERMSPNTNRTSSIYRHRRGGSDGGSLDKTDGLQYDWIKDYQNRINSPQDCINYWERFEDILSKRPDSPVRKTNFECDKLYDGEDAQTAIRTKLRRIMRHVDLDRITSRVIRKTLEQEMGEDLKEFRTFIDEEILIVLGQLDESSKITDYMYLGSEWNAGNFDELERNKITHILNVTREIDNFFAGSFKYKNIRVWDLGILLI